MVILENDRGERILLGETSGDAILANFPDFKEEYETYNVNIELMIGLNHMNSDINIITILGTWCKDSRREVSRFLKIMYSISNSKIDLRFYGVDRSKKDEKGITASLNVEYVPTFIVSKNGKEMGRIVEKPKHTFEEDLIEITIRQKCFL